MKKTFLLLTAALFAFNISAQNKITVDKLGQFTDLQVNGKIELFVTMDSKLPLGMSIDMNGNDPNQLKWWEEEDALQIKYSPKSKGQPVIIHLNCHSIKSLDIQTASVTVESRWEQNMVTLNAGSSARLTADISCRDIKVTSQTSAAVVLKGTADYADYDVRSKSTLDARAFDAVSATLRAGGYSESYVYGRDRLIIDAVDGASVFYRGNPEIMRQRTTRGGHTNPIGE